MKINFGKYNGYTTKEVAIIDSGYASWAAQNLKNASLRQAFAQALIDAKIATDEEIASAHEDPNSEHYGKVLEMVKADKAKEDAEKAEIDECIARHAASINVGAVKFGELIRGFVSRNVFSHDLDPAKFSTPARYQAFKACLDEVYAIERKHFLAI